MSYTCCDRFHLLDEEDASFFIHVETEMHRSVEKFGEQNHCPADWLMILGEEVGEANKAALEHKFALLKGIQGRADLEDFEKEIIQVAAVAINILRSLDRNELNPKHKAEEKRADEYVTFTCVDGNWTKRCAFCKGVCQYGNPAAYVYPGDYVHPRADGPNDSTADATTDRGRADTSVDNQAASDAAPPDRPEDVRLPD